MSNPYTERVQRLRKATESQSPASTTAAPRPRGRLLALAAALGPRSTVLMRGHGSTVVGASLEQAVYRAIYAEVNARLQTQARQLGEVTYLNANEAAKAAAINDTQLPRVWELWAREIGAVE